MKYCHSIYRTERSKTQEVKVGHLGVGGDNPIRIQSMTTSNTRDVGATVEQVMKLADNGCEIVRMTVQGMKEAEACEEIKNTLLQKGYTTPLVADIHFYPPAAMRVADSVDKIRINPGNFADRRATFKVIEYDDLSYAAELARIEELFIPLVEKLKRLKKALRIGTNQGSLSDRIMNRYGDTPAGMVESAFEYTRICRKLDYHSLIFSMKSSNPLIMIQAYRLIAARMKEEGWNYPLHLGVTEAGEGEDGRVKSSIGIGTLLLDGLGDTLRVSLTEDPWNEIDPCRRLIHFAKNREMKGVEPYEERHRDFMNIQRRPLPGFSSILHRDGTTILSVTNDQILTDDFYAQLGMIVQFNLLTKSKATVDALLLEEAPASNQHYQILERVQKAGVALLSRNFELHGAFPLYTSEEAKGKNLSQAGLIIRGNESLLVTETPAFILFSPLESPLHETRRFIEGLRANKKEIPVLLYLSYSCSPEDLVIQASAEGGALLSDGLGDGLVIASREAKLDLLRNLTFGILQGVRMRTSKTEFISCPGCGRTLFELQQVSRKIRERTGHLPGVKIAIMGCIVNGPGEMADADFGYVGSKPGMIDLYVGKQCVERNIAFADAEDKLVDLIKQHGRWEEKSDNPILVLT